RPARPDATGPACHCGERDPGPLNRGRRPGFLGPGAEWSSLLAKLSCGGGLMPVSSKPFLTLTAADLMSRRVLAIPQEMSLPRAAHLLSQEQVSGAPVVDGQGRCVGVLSATDFVHWAERSGATARTSPRTQ